jgi:hypothetical protein
MPDRATYEELAGQLDMWADFATPACNRVRGTELAHLPKPTPRQVALAADDDIALECIAAGLA